MKKIFIILISLIFSQAFFVFSENEKSLSENLQPEQNKSEIGNSENNETESKILPEEKKKEDDSIGVRLGRKFSEIISEIQKRIPQIIEKKQDFYTEGIRGFLEKISPELDYIADETQLSHPTKNDDFEFQRPVIIASQKILYIRIDGFTEQNFIRLKEECVDISRFKNQPVGLIIDLRSANSENGIISAEYASIFYEGEILAFTKNNIKGIIKCPVMILMGEKTRGDGEIFASLLMKSGKAMLVGEKSAGMPFARFPVKLESGGILLIPDIPSDLHWIEIAPLEPSITVKAYPQIDYSKISGEKGSENSDDAIRRVCDLLISLEALHKEKEKNPTP